MEVVRVKKDKNYTTINNTIFKNKSISCKSKGIFATIMSLPNDWDFSISGMSSVLKEGKKSIYGAIKELQEYGYVEKTTTRNDKGLITGVEYKFFETPMNKGIDPDSHNRHADNRDADNAPQLSTNIINDLNNKTNVIDFDALLGFFNKTTGKNLRVINRKVKNQFNARMKDGYTKADIFNAILNCYNDPFHKQNPKYLTPEFISRPDKFEKYVFATHKKQILPLDFWVRELSDEQKKLLTDKDLATWERQKTARLMEGGRMLPIKIEYEK